MHNPIELNSNLGYYTNYMNLLDMAAIAVPTGKLDSGVGFGITLFHRAFSDKKLLALASRLEQSREDSRGSTALAAGGCNEFIPLVVCGAHMNNLPLNWQLRERGGEFLRACRTAEQYRMFALKSGAVARPLLLRDSTSKQTIEIEVWQIPAAEFGSFVAEIPAPLGIGKVLLEDGTSLSGFIGEAAGNQDAEEITSFGGWRAWLKSVS